MKTEELIGALGAQPLPAPALDPRRLGAQVVALVALVVAVFLAVLGPRDGLGQALAEPLVALKTALPLTLAALAYPLALASLRPEARPGARGWLLAAPGAVTAALWGITFLRTPAPARFAEVSPASLAECLVLIPLISALPAWAALKLAQRGAPSHPARTGALLGLAVSASAAAGYSFFCIRDNPLFYITWYGVAIALVTLASALAGHRWLRW